MKNERTIGNLLVHGIKRLYQKSNIDKDLHDDAKDRVFCPICGSSFPIFGSVGVKKRENALCHECHSLERHRLMYLYLASLGLFNDTGNVTLLHFAPEKALYQIFSEAEHIEYHPCDLSPKRFKDPKSVPNKKVDIPAIPFENDSFDMIICNHVLEHIPDDKEAMDELYQVMKKGGRGYFQVPIDYNRDKTYEDFSLNKKWQRKIAFGQHDHVRYYAKDYKDKLAERGFKIQVDDYVTCFSKEEQFKLGLDPEERIYFCEK